MDDKQVLRGEILARRKRISIIENAELSARACEALLHLPVYRRAKTVMGYLGMRNEMTPHGFIRQALRDGKRVCLPKIRGDSLAAIVYTDQSAIVPAAFGTREIARGEEVPPEAIDLFIVPGVAFDESGGRLGYGKGYYDRFLSGVPGVKAGVAFHMQLVPDVFSEPHDVKMDLIVTDRAVIDCAEGEGI